MYSTCITMLFSNNQLLTCFVRICTEETQIHYFQLKFVSTYRKEMKIIAITYFLTTLPIMTTKIAITSYLVALDSH